MNDDSKNLCQWETRFRRSNLIDTNVFSLDSKRLNSHDGLANGFSKLFRWSETKCNRHRTCLPVHLEMQKRYGNWKFAIATQKRLTRNLDFSTKCGNKNWLNNVILKNKSSKIDDKRRSKDTQEYVLKNV